MVVAPERCGQPTAPRLPGRFCLQEVLGCSVPQCCGAPLQSEMLDGHYCTRQMALFAILWSDSSQYDHSRNYDIVKAYQPGQFVILDDLRA